ncbi:MAG: hypothetical protein A3G34_16495 [Candidatus Lindowbacteria bacterium RIFCSPLOWO2_12_FULL_62_27]|nr:MAG: hypothetical protein A3I06_00095 [Candidatus Lindowbacteria bacterium RIFCSPLOWO2_02_FULL_62_12]OGH58340.1 MAG: hypothetical protein A3G34_16495 [Candidatus Lindowbacteria bacterium RIFCSPLOWO2_12_FULL_62_27]
MWSLKCIAGRVCRNSISTSGTQAIVPIIMAKLYGIKTKALVQAVKRNPGKFPPDFVFRLTWKEHRSLRSQFVTLLTSVYLKYVILNRSW